MRKLALTLSTACLLLFGAPLAGHAAAQPPVPHPFPSTDGASGSQPARQQPPPSTSTPAQQPSTSAPAQQPATPPAAGQSDEAALVAKMGFPLYPNAQFLGTFDAGQGQTFYLFGSTAPYNTLVQYYRSVLKQGGHQVFDPPVATYTFEVGDFDDNRMAFPPGVTIKDYQSETSAGYPNPTPGGQPATFPTVIQVVSAPAPQAPR